VNRHPVTRQLAALASGALATVLLSGCSGQGNPEAGNARAVAVSFSQGVSAATAKSCGLLAPQTLKELEDRDGPCVGALPDELQATPGPVESVQVYGKDAIVHLSSDTVFLARFGDGWRVTAAGCTRPQVGRPYDCKVKGD
jgi:hypothetical protein